MYKSHWVKWPVYWYAYITMVKGVYDPNGLLAQWMFFVNDPNGLLAQ